MKIKQNVVTIHVLHAQLPLCGFTTALPKDWPEGVVFVTKAELASVPTNIAHKICATCKEKAS
jgi:hypothetical protein